MATCAGRVTDLLLLKLKLLGLVENAYFSLCLSDHHPPQRGSGAQVVQCSGSSLISFPPRSPSLSPFESVVLALFSALNGRASERELATRPHFSIQLYFFSTVSYINSSSVFGGRGLVKCGPI